MAAEYVSHLSVDFTATAFEHLPEFSQIESLLNFTASRESLAGEVGIWLCTDVEIADLHARFMGIAGPTDVITFPADDSDGGAYLGDIAVSVDTALVQATDAAHSPEREIAYLCLHGLLHLAGYDDLTEGGRSEMIARQEELLSDFEQKTRTDWTTPRSG